MQDMVAFLIPLKHHDNCPDYPAVWDLLSRTVASICNSMSGKYHIVIAGSKALPWSKTPIDLNKVTFLEADWPPVVSAQPRPVAGETVTNVVRSQVFTEHTRDKDQKRRTALEWAERELGPSHYFLMDADDYVSTYLVSSILKHRPDRAMGVVNGYYYAPDSGLVMRKSNLFQNCGSTVAVSAKFMKEIVQMDKPGFLGGHKAWIKYCSFPDEQRLILYTIHNDNHGKYLWNFGSSLSERGRPITNHLVKTFGVVRP